MPKQSENKLRRTFEEKQLDTLAEQLVQRDWTAALLRQRIAALDDKLAAGDMPILEGVSVSDERGQLPEHTGFPLAHTEATDNSPEEDAFAAFLEG